MCIYIYIYNKEREGEIEREREMWSVREIDRGRPQAHPAEEEREGERDSILFNIY